MRAVILVGGEGTRLRPLTYSLPKQMLPVVEVPMLERVLGHLSAHGVNDVVLSLGYRPDAFTSAYPDGRCGGARLTYVVEETPLDTAGAIRFAATTAGIDERFLVFNGDVLTEFDITSLIEFHAAAGGEATIALTPVEDPSGFGVVPTSDDGKVSAFIEKPAPGTAPTNLINAGIYVFEREVLDRIDDGRRVNVERETFPALVADGALYAMASEAYWLDVGTPERYLTASRDLLDGTREGPPTKEATASASGWVAGVASVLGPVRGSYIGDGAKVEGAVETSVVGTGALVATGATIRGSVLLAGATVEADATVIDSVVGPHAVVGAGARVDGWSVIGVGAHVEAGAQLDGARVPE